MIKKILITFFALLVTQNTFALIEVGPLLGLRFDSATSSNSATSYSTGTGYQIGGLAYLTFFPTLHIRSGVILKTRAINAEVPGAYKWEIVDSTFDIPANIQWSIPLVNFYVFGGLIYSSTQNTTCRSKTDGVSVTCNSKTPDDMIVDIGVGYDFINLAILKFAAEFEYDYGTRNLSSSADSSFYSRGYTINAVARFGF